MTVTMTLATLSMAAFWCASTMAILTAINGRSGWMKLFIGVAISMLVLSTVRPLTIVDALCGLAITMLLGALYVFIGWKITSRSDKTTTQ